MKKPRVLVAMTSHSTKGDSGERTGAYLPEIAHPYDVFARAGFDVDFASVAGGRVPLDGADGKDPLLAPFQPGGPLEGRLLDSLPASAVDPARYDAVFFAGGHGTMWDFADCEAFAKVAAAIHEKGGVVSAVCHGPAALVNVKLSSGAWLVGTRDYTGITKGSAGSRTMLGQLLPDGKIATLATFPSDGDTSYPAMVLHDGKLWFSYYSSHEGKTSIYVAEIRLGSSLQD